MVINSRQKGRRGELEVARLIALALGVEVQINYAQSAIGGYDIAVWGWAIEVKRAEKLDLPAWQKQALASAWKDKLMPVLWHRKNHARYWDVYMPASVFLVVWGGQGPFTEGDWICMSADVAIATMRMRYGSENLRGQSGFNDTGTSENSCRPGNAERETVLVDKPGIAVVGTVT